MYSDSEIIKSCLIMCLNNKNVQRMYLFIIWWDFSLLITTLVQWNKEKGMVYALVCLMVYSYGFRPMTRSIIRDLLGVQTRCSLQCKCGLTSDKVVDGTHINLSYPDCRPGGELLSLFKKTQLKPCNLFNSSADWEIKINYHKQFT